MTTPTPEHAMSVEKLIERFETVLNKPWADGVVQRIEVGREHADHILSALRALVAERRRGEALCEAAMPMLEAVIYKHGERSLFDDPSTWNHDAHLHDVTHTYSEVLALRTALTAYDAANPHPPAAEGGSR